MLPANMGHHERFTLKLQVADEALEPAILPSLHYTHQLHVRLGPAFYTHVVFLLFR